MLFEPLFAEGWRIAFAHRTFAWDAQSDDLAHVHVIIVGMTQDDKVKPRLFEYADINGDPVEHAANNINGYLIDGPNIFVRKRSKPLSPELAVASFGSKPTDGGHLIINDRASYDEAMADPAVAPYVRPFRMGRELINGIDRWCLWLVDAKPSDMKRSKFIADRVEAVREMRLASKKAVTRQKASTAWLFDENHQPDTQYLAIPRVFSGRREYATCDWYSPEIIAGDKVYTCLDPDGFSFAAIESSMYMAWQKAIGGRLKSDPSFSNTVVWNNLPLPTLDGETRQRVIDAGKAVLAARANHPGQSLADLYDPTFMPADLRKAHAELDKVVDVAFGARKPCKSNGERLQILFDHYIEMTS